MNRDFKKLLWAKISSLFAEGLCFLVVLKWIEVQTGGSLLSLTWFYMIIFLPAMIFALPISAYIEGRNLKKVMIYSDSARFFLYILFLLAIIFGDIPFYIGYIVIVIEIILYLYFEPASQSIVPKLIGEMNIAKANSLLTIGHTSIRIFGSFVGALLIGLNIDIVYLLSLSLVFIFISILFVQKIELTHFEIKIKDNNKQKKSIKEGLIYVRQDNLVMVLLITFLFFQIVFTARELISVAYLVDLGMGVEKVGYFGGIVSLGALVGALLLPKIYQLNKIKIIMTLIYFLSAFMFFMFAISNYYILTLVIFLFFGLLNSIGRGVVTTFLHERVEEGKRVRIFGVFNFVRTFSAFVGIFSFGLLLNVISVTSVISISAITLLFISILTFGLLSKSE